LYLFWTEGSENSGRMGEERRIKSKKDG
jgi:hypothetical protein